MHNSSHRRQDRVPKMAAAAHAAASLGSPSVPFELINPLLARHIRLILSSLFIIFLSLL
jgi:hypothetical protein